MARIVCAAGDRHEALSPADPLGRLLQTSLLSSRYDDTSGPRGKELCRNRLADSSASSGDQCDSAIHPNIHAIPLSAA